MDIDQTRQLNILQKRVDNLIKPEVPPFSVTPFSGLNPIINGGMNIDQRTGPYTSVANGTVTLDRFIYQKSGTMVHDVSQVVSGPTTSLPFGAYMLVDCTTADTSIAAGDFCQIVYPMEGYDWVPFAAIDGFWVTFWVNPPITGTYCMAFRNSGPDISHVVEYTATASTWQEIEVFVSASPTAGTWNYTNGVGLYLSWCLAAGSTYHTTAGAWAIGNFFATSNQVNACNSTSNNFQLSNIKLSKKPTDYTAPSYQQELARAQRYYWQHNAGFTYPIASCIATSTTQARCLATTPVQMRTLATIGGSALRLRGNGANVAVTSTTPVGVEPNGVIFDATTASGLTTNHTYILLSDVAGPVTFTAELS